MQTVFLTAASAAAACASTGPDQPGVWGAEQASLTVEENKSTLYILAGGGCYGSFGEIDQPIPSGAFTIAGRYTQLTGAFPGHVEYPAQFTGSVSGRHLTLRVTVAALPLSLGPFTLTSGIATTWPACLYP